MKTFFGNTPVSPVRPIGPPVADGSLPHPVNRTADMGAPPVRIAVYDSLAAPPRVEEVFGENPRALIEVLSSRTYQLSHDAGGALPYVVIREIVENLIHARFDEVVVSVLDGGNTIRFADQGPGIGDKDRAFQPGFSTASDEMKRIIKGVGSGLPVAKECLGFAGGTIIIEDNLERGTVVTLGTIPVSAPEESAAGASSSPVDEGALSLSTRQKQVLSLTMEFGSVGPTVVSRELGVGLSTAYRDLASLEAEGLISSDETGKRALSARGVHCLDALFNG
ncbi:MAG: ATP-binding protein [Coriobacteriia bacterium]|nr:ATP-binding protein [Coriobacteriia bacterium]